MCELVVVASCRELVRAAGPSACVRARGGTCGQSKPCLDCVSGFIEKCLLHKPSIVLHGVHNTVIDLRVSETCFCTLLDCGRLVLACCWFAYWPGGCV